MDKIIRDIIFVALTERGFLVEEEGNVLHVEEEDTTFGVDVTVEVKP